MNLSIYYSVQLNFKQNIYALTQRSAWFFGIEYQYVFEFHMWTAPPIKIVKSINSIVLCIDQLRYRWRALGYIDFNFIIFIFFIAVQIDANNFRTASE